MPIRERYVWVCTNRRADDNPKGSCAQKGSEELTALLKQATKSAGLHDRVRVCSSSCINVCEQGITVAVMPDNILLGHVTAEDIPALIEGLRSAGGVAADPTLSAKRVRAAPEETPTVRLQPLRGPLRRPEP